VGIETRVVLLLCLQGRFSQSQEDLWIEVLPVIRMLCMGMGKNRMDAF
jgi:hypothetical protein